MQYLTDDALTNAYNEAIEMKLDKSFLSLLKKEILNRGIEVK
ncbi:sporulation histidine kinase inhibitor Sda [Virgibacillus byunsanensis]|uniref:Sporulation histidine kinase inhibitor Sda n=1 Tax=Virgibacillus byunsanensis TaxID=570945 RepID=A0ABW3LSC8_9BACI